MNIADNREGLIPYLPAFCFTFVLISSKFNYESYRSVLLKTYVPFKFCSWAYLFATSTTDTSTLHRRFRLACCDSRARAYRRTDYRYYAAAVREVRIENGLGWDMS